MLVEEGLSDSEVARRSDVPRRTVRDWRAGGYPAERHDCPWCGSGRLRAPASYAYLLGLYLGDGCLARVGRVWQLRIYLDQRYPGIIAAASEAISAIRPGRRVTLVPRQGCVAVSA